jgi:hypothetical protein
LREPGVMWDSAIEVLAALMYSGIEARSEDGMATEHPSKSADNLWGETLPCGTSFIHDTGRRPAAGSSANLRTGNRRCCDFLPLNFLTLNFPGAAVIAWAVVTSFCYLRLCMIHAD